MSEQLENSARTQAIAWAANDKFDEVTAHSQALDIISRAEAQGVPVPVEAFKRRAVRVVAARALANGNYYQINRHGIHPNGMFDHHFPPPQNQIAPEVKLFRQLEFLVRYGAPLNFEPRSFETEMDQAMDMAAFNFDQGEKNMSYSVERLARLNAETADEHALLGQLGVEVE